MKMSFVKGEVSDLCNNSGNLDPNWITRHVRRKWTSHPPGIRGWSVSMALKALGIRKCVSSGLASYMFAILCISIIFCCSLFTCYQWVVWGSAPVLQPENIALHLSWTSICMSDCRYLHWEATFWLGNYWRDSLTYWSYRNWQLPRDLITRY